MSKNCPSIHQFEKACIIHETPESVLFQYTKSETLKSLIDNKKIWATEYRYLNDPTEFRHGAQLFVDRLESFLKTKSGDWRRFMDSFSVEIKNPKFIKLFLASFTEEGDLLSQWRGYGDFGQGLSLGLNTSKMRKVSDETLFWRKVIYDDTEKNKKVDFVFEKFSEAWQSLPASINGGGADHEQITHLMVTLTQVVMVNAISFKDKAWHEEKEWRLIKLLPSNPTTEYNYIPKIRNRQADLIEYIELDLDTDFLKCAYVGPRSNFINQRNAMKVIAGEKIDVRKSSIPWV